MVPVKQLIIGDLRPTIGATARPAHAPPAEEESP